MGVLPASGKEAYTTTRGRMIVSNGYCDGGCAERAQQSAAQLQPMQQESAQPEPVHQMTALPQSVRLPG